MTEALTEAKREDTQAAGPAPPLIPIQEPWRGVLPAHRLYWGVVPQDRTADLTADVYAVERVLPVDSDRMQIAWTRLPDGARLIVGIEPERLRAELALQAGSAGQLWALGPDQLPAPIAERLGDAATAAAVAARLNLLHGAFEPADRRRLRRWCLAAGFLGLAVALGGLLVATRQRMVWAHEQSARLTADVQRRIDTALPAAAGDQTTANERLVMELRRFDAMTALGAATAWDVPRVTEQLIAAIPPDVRVQVEGWTITGGQASARVRLPTLAMAERLHQAWAGVAEANRYHLDPLQAQQVEGMAVATIALRAGSQP